MGHVASLSQLQRPRWASVNGDLVDYEDVTIHVSAEALTRALSVFEGLKGYWDEASEEFGLRTPERHYARLCRSAALFEIPIDFTCENYVDACMALGRKLITTDKDLWFRTTLYVVDGHWGEGTRADLVITAFLQSKELAPPMKLGVSTWRRSGDVQLPARVKSSANYVVARLARIEVGRRSYDDAVMLNDQGRVAESTGSCIVALVGRAVVTPPHSEGVLPSISLDLVEQICRRDGVPFERRPLERSELLVADEVALVGTITELTPVSEIDHRSYRTNGLLADLRRRYVDAMRRVAPLDGVEFARLKATEIDPT
jgi:branched-chain amino acid aminotransferase